VSLYFPYGVISSFELDRDLLILLFFSLPGHSLLELCSVYLIFCVYNSSAVAWQLTLNYPEKQKEISGERGHSGDMKVPEGDLCILLFRSLISSDKPVSLFLSIH
jgi:hypothetical protein